MNKPHPSSLKDGNKTSSGNIFMDIEAFALKKKKEKSFKKYQKTKFAEDFQQYKAC